MISASTALVSIIIPTYNRRELLPDAVVSCLAQTYPNIEIIIVDDGSTDGTREMVEGRLSEVGGRKSEESREWVGRNIRYEYQANAGASAARNRGLELANGNYVQFLDSDDLLFREKISRQAAVLEQSDNVDMAGCSCYGQLGVASGEGARNTRIGIYCRTPREYVERLSSRLVHGMQTSAPLWRKSFLAGQAGWRTNISLGDDLEYHIRLLAAAKGMVFVEQELFWVREHTGPRLSDFIKGREKVLSLFRTRQAIYETLTKAGLWNGSTQKNFLGAMRTIYASVLALGTDGDIREMECFILGIARHPHRRFQLPGLIAARRFLGKKTLLKAHRFLARMKGWKA
jgi:GT2 family glycosyltransferase